jgi:hypothetical protein
MGKIQISKLLPILFIVLSVSNQGCKQKSKVIGLTKAEKGQGWELLFEGNSNEKWRGYNQDAFPSYGWTVKDGVVECLYTGAGEKGSAGDIMTKKQYKDFELTLEWKLSKGGNSGIIYLIKEIPGQPAWHGAPEFQILDGENYGMPLRPAQLAGSVYDLYPANPQNVKPYGEWNQIRLVVKNKKVEHWQNGVKVAEYVVNSEDMKERVKGTKFNEFPEFKEIAEQGHICLQDHGGGVWFRNLKIREL